MLEALINQRLCFPSSLPNRHQFIYGLWIMKAVYIHPICTILSLHVVDLGYAVYIAIGLSQEKGQEITHSFC